MFYYEHIIGWIPGRVATAYAGANGDPTKEKRFHQRKEKKTICNAEKLNGQKSHISQEICNLCISSYLRS